MDTLRIYRRDEFEYHDIDHSTCDCFPAVRFADNGQMVIIHRSLIDPPETEDLFIEEVDDIMCRINKSINTSNEFDI